MQNKAKMLPRTTGGRRGRPAEVSGQDDALPPLLDAAGGVAGVDDEGAGAHDQGIVEGGVVRGDEHHIRLRQRFSGVDSMRKS
jgi:hypothetical protein